MAKNFVAIILSVFTISLISCTKDPVACFRFSTETVKVGDTLSLINCSSNFTDVKWSLPFGAITSVVNPRIKVQNEGVYEVTLSVGLENFAKSNSITKSILVKP